MEKTLNTVDLNLLRALRTLLEERSVTRAASRLFVTQPAMSKSLHRLRELFDDPLLVRGSDGLVLTPRANELIGPLEQIFAQVENCFTPPHFDPATAQGRVRVAAPEQFAFVTMPDLLLRLREKAPNLTLDSQHLMDDYLEKLADDSLDFVIYTNQPYPNDFNATQIYSAKPMCWCRKGHPLVKKRNISLADICAYPLVTLRRQNFLQEDVYVLKKEITAARLKSNVILDTNHMLLAIDALFKTNALMLAPDYLSRLPMLQGGIVALPLSQIPAYGRFRAGLFLVQHKRTLNSPLHRWIANEISEAFAA